MAMAPPIRPAPLRPPLAPPPGIPAALKVSAVIAGDDLPRIVASDARDGDFVELRMQVPAGPGRPGELLTARFPAKTYLKHQAAIERLDGACTGLLTGRIARAGELADVSLNIQPGRPAPPLDRAAGA